MIRFLWRAYVPGTQGWVWFWLILLGISIYGQNPYAMVYNATLFALNLYSWDYQRRRAAGLLIIPESPK